MNGMRIFAALLATACVFIGWLMAGRDEPEFGRALIIGAAILIAGILISSAVLETAKKT